MNNDQAPNENAPEETPQSSPAPQSFTPSVQAETPVQQNSFFASQPVDQQSAIPADQPPVQKKRKIPLFAIIVAAALIVLIGGGVAAYNLYYQNPQKVVADALSATISAKTASYTGTIAIKSDTTTMKLTFDGQNDSTTGLVNLTADVTADKVKFSLKGSGEFDKDGNLYFKVQNVKDTITSILSASGVTLDLTPFDSLIAKIENKWIKVSADDLKTYSQDYSKTQTCVTDALKMYNTDVAAKKEIETVYKNNQFFTIDKKLGSKTINGTGSLGYAITIDDAKTTAFGKALENTAIGKKIKSCDTSNTTSTTTTSTGPTKATAELWVSRFGHTPTQFSVNASDNTTSVAATVTPVFNKPVTITAPTDTTTIKAIGDAYTQALNDYIASFSTVN